MKRHVVGLIIAAIALVGCEDNGTDVDDDPIAFDVTIENVSSAYAYRAAGGFTIPEGAEDPGVIGPGDAYEFTVPGLPGDRLSFATMFVQSNDLFYAPAEAGIALYDANDDPISGDITSQVMLWDAGTEVNQEPGLGEDQAPRQDEEDTGAEDPNDAVRLATDDFGNLPAVSEVIQVTVTPNAGNTFTVRVENVSTSTTLSTSDGGSVAVPLTPGVWVIHTGDAPLFTTGESASAGLEALAEDGAVTGFLGDLADDTGIVSPVSPGAWAVLDNAAPFFRMGEAASAGLEALAEDGDPSTLLNELMAHDAVASAGVFNTPTGATSPGPLFPGQTYTFTVEAAPGDQLQLATMYVQSNDGFYAFNPGGIILFPAGGPVSGDVTANLSLWDAGTELNERPGFGPNQAPRQAAADTGEDEDGTVGARPDGYQYDRYGYGIAAEVIRVTVTPAATDG